MSEYLAVTLAMCAIFAALVLTGLLVFGWGNPFPPISA